MPERKGGRHPVVHAAAGEVALQICEEDIGQLPRQVTARPIREQAGEGDAGLLFALEQLLEKRKAEETPGVFRAGESGDQPAGPWWIDTSRSGHYCVHPDRAPVLWRPRPASAEGVEIRQLRGSGVGRAQWAEGEVTAAWPAELALEDGASYVLQRSRSPRRQIILHLLGKEAAEDELQQLVGLVGHGCMQQAETLAAALE